MDEIVQNLDADPPPDPIVSAAPPLAPSTVPGELIQLKRESTWPNLLGILCIVSALLGMFMNFLMAKYQFSLPNSFVDPMPYILEHSEYAPIVSINTRWESFDLGINVLRGINATFLLCVAIMILRRRPTVSRYMLGYIILQASLVFFEFGKTTLMYQEKLAAIEAMETDLNGTVSMWINTSGLLVLPAKLLIWYLLLPFLLFIWFRRTKIKDEIANW